MLSSAFPDSGRQKTLRMQKEYEVQNFIEIFVILPGRLFVFLIANLTIVIFKNHNLHHTE